MPDNQSNLFYNVMPEVTAGPVKKPDAVIPEQPKPEPQPQPQPAPVSVPTPKVAPQVSSSEGVTILNNSIPSGSRRKKPLLIIGLILVLLIAAAASYFLYFKNSKEATNDQQGNQQNTEPENPEVTTPADWLLKFFGTETCTELVTCGDKADPDRDGLENKAEYDIGTDPNNNDSDSDGLADGDEALVFSTDPLLSRTFRDGEYNDIDFIKGGYDITTNEPYTNEALFNIKTKVKQYGLHQPTLTSLGQLSFQLYDFTDPSIPPLPANLDVSPEAKLDRDSQRQSTIKKISSALLKYQSEKKTFPPGNDFIAMADAIKSYNTLATNYNDPINQAPYVYGYQTAANNTEFTLTYYSETQNQLIKYITKNAREDSAKEDTKAYDEQRKLDLENIQQTLLVYSSTHIDSAGSAEFVFPPKEKLRTELIPRYMKTFPVDPVSKIDYQYEVAPTFDSFTIKAQLQNPATGTTGYMCNQLECKVY
jgi:hypothetical protein